MRSIEFSYFFTPVPEPRLASDPTTPFSQLQVSAWPPTLLPSLPTPCQSPLLCLCRHLYYLRGSGRPESLHAVSGEGMAPLGIQVVDSLAGGPPVPLTVWDLRCLLLHKVVCGSGSWCAQWPSQPALMLAQRGHCWGLLSSLALVQGLQVSLSPL